MKLRNCLVHQFIQHHDIATPSGCEAASACLDRKYELIDRTFRELQGWRASVHAALIAFRQQLDPGELPEELLYREHP